MGLFGNKKPEAGPQAVAEYKVIYKGGLQQLPKSKVGGIELKFWPDRLTLDPTTASKKFWEPLALYYAAIQNLTIEQRQVSAAENLLSAGKGGGSRDLATMNNIHLHYAGPDGHPVMLRLEMLTGVTVTGQAKKCAEMLDQLRAHRILDQITAGIPPAPTAGGGVADELAKLGQLAQQGILSPDEFAAAKARLLGQ